MPLLATVDISHAAEHGHETHTWIEGWVSVSYFTQFPNDPEAGRVLPVHYPLTYEKLAAYDFDPNAEYLYALELLSEHGDSFGLAARLDREIEGGRELVGAATTVPDCLTA